MAPQFFGTIAKHLKSENIVDSVKGFERLIVEAIWYRITQLQTVE